MKEEKNYVILYKSVITGEWKPVDGILYTDREANRELRQLKCLCSPYSFRKKLVCTRQVEVATARDTMLND